MSILATAGRSKIYNTDGSGRDTYVHANSGGFSVPNQPAAASRGGTFGMQMRETSPAHIGRGGGQGSPGKTIHYQVNGTGRDSYIAQNHGGFAANYSWQSDQNAYVNSLRGYPTTVQEQQRAVYTHSKKSSQRDHFVEGQCGLRSPKARNDVRMLKTFQLMQAQRLALPKRTTSVIDGAVSRASFNANSTRQSAHFLRKTGGLSQSFQANELSQLKQQTSAFDHAQTLTKSSLHDILQPSHTINGSLPKYRPSAAMMENNALDLPIDAAMAVAAKRDSSLDNVDARLERVRIMQGNVHDVGASSFQNHRK